jgi:hypothetical protein
METLNHNKIYFSQADMLLDSEVAFALLKPAQWIHTETTYTSSIESENALLFVQLLNTMKFSDRLVCSTMHEFFLNTTQRKSFSQFFNQNVLVEDYFNNGNLDISFLKIQVNRLWIQFFADMIAKSIISSAPDNITFQIV